MERPIAMVVEDDGLQRELVATLLEESQMDVIRCDSAEEAWQALQQINRHVVMLFTDVNLAGKIDGVELAHCVTRQYRDIHVIVTSGSELTKSLPERATWMPKPWKPLDVVREAQRALPS